MAIKSRTVVSSMLWNLLERFSTQFVSFAISIILARLLMPSDYGIIAIVVVFISFSNVIIDGGFNTALIQKKDADQTDFSTIFWFCLFVATILYAILFFGAPLVSRFYKNDILTPVLRILGLDVFFTSFNSIQRAYVSKHMMFRKLFYINGIALIISGTVGVIMAYLNYGVWALVGQGLVKSMACCVLMWFTVRWHPTIEFSKQRFGTLFNYGWKILLTNLLISVFENIRSLVIGKIYKPATLAFFDRGKALPHLIMSNITSSINTVLLPTFSEEQDNRIRVKQMIRRSVQISYFFVCPLLVGFFFTSKEIVLILLTEKWLPCVPFVKIFCIAFLLMPIQNVNMTAIKSLGYSGITLKLETIKKIIEAVILVISFLINALAVAWGIVIYNFICLFINLRPLKKLADYGAFEQIRDVAPTFFIALIMGGIVYLMELLNLNTVLTLTIQVLFGALVYYGLCRAFKLDSYLYVIDYVKRFRNKDE